MHGTQAAGPQETAVLIRGVTAVGFTGGAPSRPLDVWVGADGLVQSVRPSGVAARGKAGVEVDARGCLMSPGWVDLHTHVWKGFEAGVDADRIGPRAGVTVVVDAGSTGEACFAGFRSFVLEGSPFPVLAFLNVGSAGVEAYTPAGINPARAARCVEENRRYIRGIKVLASKKYVGAEWFYPVVAAKRLAADLGLPLMVHVAEPPAYIEELLGILGSGDVITHCFHGKAGNSLRTSAARVLPLYRAARERGILLDVGHGAASFSVEAARKAVDEGLQPDTVSTDLHAENIDGPVWSLALTASKMLACGMGLEEMVAAISTTPARVIGLEGHGRLEEGAEARFTIFDVLEGSYEFRDSNAPDDFTSGSDARYQERFTGRAVLRPRWCVIGAAAAECEPMRGIVSS